MVMYLSDHKIIDVRPLTNVEMEEEGWDGESAPLAIVCDDGMILYASRDDEGNGPGVIIGLSEKFIGLKILSLKRITKTQKKKYSWDGWNQHPYILCLEDRRKLIPASDASYNSPGTLFAKLPGGKHISF